MIANQTDPYATSRARRDGEISDYDSFITLAGHIYLAGKDASALRALVARDSNYICYICGELCPEWDGDLEHLRGKTRFSRCWCHKRKLADGTICSNVGWCHGMRSTHPCHRDKHNREVRLKTLK